MGSPGSLADVIKALALDIDMTESERRIPTSHLSRAHNIFQRRNALGSEMANVACPRLT